jgi:hypothetical protein
VQLYLHSPNAPSWRGAQLGGAQGQHYLYLYLNLNLKTFAKSVLRTIFGPKAEKASGDWRKLHNVLHN